MIQKQRNIISRSHFSLYILMSFLMALSLANTGANSHPVFLNSFSALSLSCQTNSLKTANLRTILCTLNFYCACNDFWNLFVLRKFLRVARCWGPSKFTEANYCPKLPPSLVITKQKFLGESVAMQVRHPTTATTKWRHGLCFVSGCGNWNFFPTLLFFLRCFTFLIQVMTAIMKVFSSILDWRSSLLFNVDMKKFS